MTISQTAHSFLEQHHVRTELVPHPRSYSAHENALAAHVAEDHIAKAVIVKDPQGYAMVVIPGSNWLELEALKKETDRDFHLADESEIGILFSDCDSGAIPPLGNAYHVETFLDQQLNSLANVYFEAGDHQNLVHVSGDDFHQLQKGVRHGYFSHH